MTNELIVQRPMKLSPHDVHDQVQHIQQMLASVMKDGEHYGVIPGCGTKKVLMKSGAEKLCLTFRLRPEYNITTINLEKGHKEFSIICGIYHIPTGEFFGQGIGMCSTMESKFRWREAKRCCPSCGVEAIIPGKKEYGGGWLCFGKKGGCGAKFAENDPSIINQKLGRVENEDIADVYNTVLKMAKKRALVDAVLTATAASDLFTQDLEEDFPTINITKNSIELVNENQLKILSDLIKKSETPETTLNWILNKSKVTSLEFLSRSQGDDLINIFTKKISAKINEASNDTSDEEWGIGPDEAFAT